MGKNIEGQIDIFEYERSIEMNFPKLIAKGLIKHSNQSYAPFHYDKQFMQTGKTVADFIHVFCNLTSTYFVFDGFEKYYSVIFSKSGTATVKRCGENYDKRNDDAVVNIQDIINSLVDEIEICEVT